MTTEDATGPRPPSAEPSPGAGWWPSPWSPSQVAAGKVSRGGLQVDQGRVFWTESRPDQAGRQVVVSFDPSASPGLLPVDVSPAGVSVRSRVHEYGGGAATISDGVLVYIDQDDQAWHRLDLVSGSASVRLGADDTPATVRHADGRVTPDRKWLLSVEEVLGSATTIHRLVATPLDAAGSSVVLVEDGDFVAAPRLSSDGRWLAWVTWDHPDMPWDTSRLVVAPFVSDGVRPSIGAVLTLGGGPGVSVGQPRWGADDSLLFVDDRTGWWLPYRVSAGSFASGAPAPADAVALVDDEAEYHGPDWVFGVHTFVELADGSVAAVRHAEGRDHLVVLRPSSAGPDAPGWSRTEVEQPCLSVSGVVSHDGRSVAVLGSTATEAQSVFAIDLAGAEPPRRLSAPPSVAVPSDRASHAAARTGSSSGQSVPGQFFAPVNPDVVAGETLPPLVVFCHGGPTASAEPGYDPVVQFFTSRGIAVAAVDYRGSTGYGRHYRDQLRGAWGEADVDDCVAYAQSLATDGLVDGDRMAIRGTSAGGLTALAALIRARCFAGAVAWYGVTDLMALAADTHDFESRYLDGLVGPLPEAAATYRERSPLHRAPDLVGRVLLLQGSDDPIVPASQAEQFADALRAGGADCQLVVFDGESHGFRRADTIEAALTTELAFYRQLFAEDGARDR